MKKTQILIADDHPVFREGVRKLLEGEEDLEVIGEANDEKPLAGRPQAEGVGPRSTQ